MVRNAWRHASSNSASSVRREPHRRHAPGGLQWGTLGDAGEKALGEGAEGRRWGRAGETGDSSLETRIS
eukprot:scaffold60151_cov17-Tisochrysis_lutea.AAC.1